MKLVREHIIFEKFTEEGDPIKDMGIGMMHQIKLWVKELKENYDEKNLLRICARHGKEEFVKYLLNKGYDVHAYNDEALRWASYYGYDKVVKLLLDAGADVHAENDGALRWASSSGHVDVVKILLNAGADVHARNDYALRWSSTYGHDKVVELLLDAGANVHAEKDRALQDASYYGRVDVVKVLLDAGANVHAENNAALRWAKNAGHDNIVKILKDHIDKEKKLKRKNIKENINEKFTEDSDPISDMGIGIDAIIKKYLKDVLHLDNSEQIKNFIFGPAFGYDAIMSFLISKNKMEIVPYLLMTKKVKPKAHKSFALRWAAAIGNVDIIKLLIEYGANPEDSDVTNSMDCAVMYGNLDAIKYLISIGVRMSEYELKRNRYKILPQDIQEKLLSDVIKNK